MVFELRIGYGNVIGGGFVLGFDEDGYVSGIFVILSVEGREELEMVGGGGDLDSDVGMVFRGGLVGVLVGVVVFFGEIVVGGRREFEVFVIFVF